MPEGPEIRRVRNRLAEVLEGRRASRIEFHLPALTEWNGRFDASTIRSVESRGKALLTHLDNGYSIYSHNQLYGRWFVTKSGERPSTGRQLRLAIHVPEHSAWLFSASAIEVWPTIDLGKHPFLARLGPDVLDPGTTAELVLERLGQKNWNRRQLGGFLTEQSFLAGLGNYLRCEILFVAGIHSRQRPCDLDPGQLERLARAIVELPRQSLETGGITNDLQRARRLLDGGASFEEARFHLFRRAGLPCRRCGTPIVLIRKKGGQVCYLCPACQPEPIQAT